MVAHGDAVQGAAHGMAQRASYRTTATAGGAQTTCKAMANTCFPVFALEQFASLWGKKNNKKKTLVAMETEIPQ